MQPVSVVSTAAILTLAAALWAAGLRRFLRTSLTLRHKVGWSCFLVAGGSAIGALLSLAEVWTTFLRVLALLPLLALADAFLLRPRRGVQYWLEACGYELGTVFGAAAAARIAFDAAGVRAFVERGG